MLFAIGVLTIYREHRVNGKIVLHSDSVYYRNSAAGMTSNGTAGGGIMDLIDYDSLPDDLIIPNGGFKTNPLLNTTSTVTVPSATQAPAKRAVIKLGGGDEKIFGKNGRKFVSKVPMHKRATAAVAPGFLGAMAQTFFGGSSDDYVSLLPHIAHSRSSLLLTCVDLFARYRTRRRYNIRTSVASSSRSIEADRSTEGVTTYIFRVFSFRSRSFVSFALFRTTLAFISPRLSIHRISVPRLCFPACASQKRVGFRSSAKRETPIHVR